MRNGDVLLTVKGRRDILHEISKRKANWIGDVWRRNCLLQGVIEGKIKEAETCYTVIQKKSRRLLMMDVLMSETCWAQKK